MPSYMCTHTVPPHYSHSDYFELPPHPRCSRTTKGSPLPRPLSRPPPCPPALQPGALHALQCPVRLAPAVVLLVLLVPALPTGVVLVRELVLGALAQAVLVVQERGQEQVRRRF